MRPLRENPPNVHVCCKTNMHEKKVVEEEVEAPGSSAVGATTEASGTMATPVEAEVAAAGKGKGPTRRALTLRRAPRPDKIARGSDVVAGEPAVLAVARNAKYLEPRNTMCLNPPTRA